MPSTTTERYLRIQRWFGDIDTHGPERVLLSMGFTIEPGWMIRKPTPSHSMTFEQLQLVAFLIEEWDYGFHKEDA